MLSERRDERVGAMVVVAAARLAKKAGKDVSVPGNRIAGGTWWPRAFALRWWRRQQRGQVAPQLVVLDARRDGGERRPGFVTGFGRRPARCARR